MQLILTVDYEVFGNGSGSVDTCVVAPTRRLLDIAESHGARVTLFVEALEFQAMKAAGQAGAEQPLRDWISVRGQLQDTVRRGHEVQLHLHPQWARAQYETGTWRLDLSRWRIADLAEDEISTMIARGCRFLEDLVRPVQSDYRPAAFRAGGWCAQPSHHLLEALSSEGVSVDSSVAPGLRHGDPGKWYDFRNAPEDQPFWGVKDDVTRPDPDGRVLEVPIAVGSVQPWGSVMRGLATRFRPMEQHPPGCAGRYESPGGIWDRVRGGLSRLADANLSMLDFCRLDAKALQRISAEWQRSRGGGGAVPLVAIGHCKNFGWEAEVHLDGFLSAMSSESKVEFTTFTRWLELVRQSRESLWC